MSSATDVRCPVRDVIESGVAYATLQSKSSPLPRLLNTTGPLNLPQKARKIGQLIQSQLPNPHRLACCLDPLCNLSIAYPAVLKYAPVLKYQAKELLPGDGPPCHFVIKDTDNAHETVPPLAPTTLRALTPRSADETEVMMAPSTLPESVTEVAAC